EGPDGERQHGTAGAGARTGRAARAALVPGDDEGEGAMRPLHSQSIAQRGACGKAPVRPHNRSPPGAGPGGEGRVRMTTTTVFDLTRSGRDAVRDHGLVAADEAHLAAVADAVGATVAELEERLAQERRAPAGLGQQALERDQQVHRLSARL